MEIKILGTGCADSQRLEKTTREVLAEMGVQARVTHVDDLEKIMAYKVTFTPGLVIDEKVMFSGRVPGKAELTSVIAAALSGV